MSAASGSSGGSGGSGGGSGGKGGAQNQTPRKRSSGSSAKRPKVRASCRVFLISSIFYAQNPNPTITRNKPNLTIQKSELFNISVNVLDSIA